MRSFTPSFLSLLAALTFLALPACAQDSRVLTDDDWCASDWSGDRDSERYCEVREIALPADRDVVTVDAGQNGGIRVLGWSRDEILLRVKVVGNARTEAAARDLAEAVVIRTGSTITVDVPDGRRKEWASASFELMVPRRSSLDLETRNGGIEIEKVDGEIAFDALNGGVTLVDLAGDVRGRTTNGGLDIVLSGSFWNGDGLDVKTTNGGIDLHVPDGYSARLETGTVNGRVHFDFPILIQGDLSRDIETDLGRGGNLIRVKTTNGSVNVRKS